MHPEGCDRIFLNPWALWEAGECAQACCQCFPSASGGQAAVCDPPCPSLSGKSKGGLSKGGLGPKGANWAKKGPFGATSALPPWVWGAEELVPIDPEKAPTGLEKAPISPEKARFPRKDLSKMGHFRRFGTTKIRRDF